MPRNKVSVIFSSSESDDEILPEADIFSNRAANLFKSRKVELKVCFDDEEEEDKPVVENKEDDLMLNIKEKLKTATPARGRRKGRGRGRKRKVNVPDEEETEDLVTDDKDKQAPKISESPIKLPLASRKILNRLESENNREEKRVNEEVKRILASCDMDFDLDNSPTDQTLEIDITLLFRYKAENFRLNVSENEKFLKIYRQVADHFNLKAHEILLCKDDRTINVEDTPSSLNLRYFDSIECISYKPTINLEDEDSNDNSFIIKLQSNDSRKRTDMPTHKLEKFSEIIKRYAVRREIPLKNIVFEFDGERIEPDQTPDDLDMESGSCVDVKILGLAPKTTTIQVNPADYVPVPKSQMLDICVLD